MHDRRDGTDVAGVIRRHDDIERGAEIGDLQREVARRGVQPAANRERRSAAGRIGDGQRQCDVRSFGRARATEPAHTREVIGEPRRSVRDAVRIAAGLLEARRRRVEVARVRIGAAGQQLAYEVRFVGFNDIIGRREPGEGVAGITPGERVGLHENGMLRHLDRPCFTAFEQFERVVPTSLG